jgi:hypothetical protein
MSFWLGFSIGFIIALAMVGLRIIVLKKKQKDQIVRFKYFTLNNRQAHHTKS